MIHYLLLLPLFVLLCLFGPYLLLSTLCPSSVAITSRGKRETVAWLKLCLMSCDYLCSVALPHSAVGWFTVCDCIS